MFSIVSQKVKLRIGSTATYPLNIHPYLYIQVHLPAHPTLTVSSKCNIDMLDLGFHFMDLVSASAYLQTYIQTNFYAAFHSSVPARSSGTYEEIKHTVTRNRRQQQLQSTGIASNDWITVDLEEMCKETVLT